MELEVISAKIEADISSFQSNMVEAAHTAVQQSEVIEGSFESLEGVTEKAGEKMGELKSTIMELVGVAGFAELIKSTLETGEELHHLSETTGMAVQAIQELQFTALQAGVSQDTMNMALNFFNRNIGEAAQGTKAAADAFDLLGVNVKNSDGTMKDNHAILLEVADAVSKYGTASERAAALQPIFGRAAMQIAPLMKDGAAGFEAAAQKAHAMGAVLSDETVKAAEEASVKLNEMKKVVGTELQTAIVSLIPVIELAAKGIARFAEAISHVITDVGTLVSKIPGLSSETEKAAEATNTAAQAHEQQAQKTEKATEAVQKHTLAQDKNRQAVRDAANTIIKSAQDAEGGQEAAINKDIATLQKAVALKLKLAGNVHKAIVQLQAQELALKQADNAKEVSDLIDKNARLMSLHDSNHTAEIVANQQKIDQLLKQETLAEADREKLMDKESKAEQTFRDQKMKAEESAASSLATLQHSKVSELAAIGKAAAVADATLRAFQGQNLAMATIPPPAGEIVGGIILGAGLANAAEMAATDLGFADGLDMVPGTTGQPTMLTAHGGESILTNDNTRRLGKMLDSFESGKGGGGGGGGVAQIELILKDDLVDFIEAQLIRRGRIGISMRAA